MTDSHGVTVLLCNLLISHLIFAPLSVAYWRGTWTLMDVYLFPDDELLSALIALAIGQVMFVVMTYAEGCLRRHLLPAGTVKFAVGSRVYIYVMAWTTVLQWRGAWQLYGYLYRYTPLSEVIALATGLVLTIGFGWTRNLAGAPFYMRNDLDVDAKKAQNYFVLPTRFDYWVSPVFCACEDSGGNLSITQAAIKPSQ
jgi:hypothetical protein